MTDSDRSTGERARQLETLDRLAQRFGHSLSSAFDRNLNAGRQLDGVLASLASKLSNVAVKAALAPVKAGVTSLVNSLLSAASEGGSTTALPSLPWKVIFSEPALARVADFSLP